MPVWWQADTRDEIHRALDLAAEFGTTVVIVGGREASKVADRLKAEHVAVILPLGFAEEPKVPTEEEYQKRPLLEQEEPLKLLVQRRDKWKQQVGTAAVLAKAGIPFAFATEGLERLDTFPAQLRALISNGLTADQALSALTTQAAKIAGLEQQAGYPRTGQARATWWHSRHRSRTSRPRPDSCWSTDSSSRSRLPSREPGKAVLAHAAGGECGRTPQPGPARPGKVRKGPGIARMPPGQAPASQRPRRKKRIPNRPRGLPGPRRPSPRRLQHPPAQSPEPSRPGTVAQHLLPGRPVPRKKLRPSRW